MLIPGDVGLHSLDDFLLTGFFPDLSRQLVDILLEMSSWQDEDDGDLTGHAD